MQTSLSRRAFLNRTALLGVAAAAAPARQSEGAPAAPRRTFKLCLAPGSVGIKVPPREAIALAQTHGFEAIEPNAGFLGSLGDADLAALRADLQAHHLAFGAAGMPVDFRKDDATFLAGMKTLPKVAADLQRAGVGRVRTWISPAHAALPYERNFEQHAARLRSIAQVLKEHGLRFGLEYVGPLTSRQKSPHPFIHTLRETRQLIAAIGTGNVGYVLDSWHWWTSGETEADLQSLQAADVVSVDINDAPAGIPRDEQQDGKRELPCATGVIPLAVFLRALQRLGYDGPVRAEPFYAPLRALPPSEACATVIASLRKAAALVA